MLPGWHAVGSALYELAERLAVERREFAVILVDLDGFKAVNDEHGRLFGHEVLKRVAEAMRCAVGRGDAVARYGGMNSRWWCRVVGIGVARLDVSAP